MPCTEYPDGRVSPQSPVILNREDMYPDIIVEQDVLDHTSDVIRDLVYQMYTTVDRDEADTLHMYRRGVPEIVIPEVPEDNISAAQIGHQLAIIGDDINARYATQYYEVICTLDMTIDRAYRVARQVLHDGTSAAWPRLMTLLCFSYRMAVSVIQRGIRGFLANVAGFVAKFFITEKIATWITEQYEMASSLFDLPDVTDAWPTVAAASSVAVVSALTVIFLKRKYG